MTGTRRLAGTPTCRTRVSAPLPIFCAPSPAYSSRAGVVNTSSLYSWSPLPTWHTGSKRGAVAGRSGVPPRQARRLQQAGRSAVAGAAASILRHLERRGAGRAPARGWAPSCGPRRRPATAVQAWERQRGKLSRSRAREITQAHRGTRSGHTRTQRDAIRASKGAQRHTTAQGRAQHASQKAAPPAGQTRRALGRGLRSERRC